MIKKDELTKIAEAKKISLQNAEKDYFLEVLLFSIFSEFGNLLVLKGGTALYKIYNLNRFSEDLDFTLNKRRFDLEKFLDKILRSLKLIGIECKVKEIEKYRNEINIKINFTGPLYSGKKESLCFISLNISLREKIMKETKKELLISSYREIPSFEIFVLNEDEIFAEKVRAILTRNKPRDLYDLWFLLKRGVKPDMNLINKKLRIYKVKFSFETFFASVNKLHNFWETDLKGLVIGDLPDFNKIKNEVLNCFK